MSTMRGLSVSEEPTMTKESQANSSSIDRVLTILEEISNHSDGISLAELVKNTEIPKPRLFAY
ncbi:helix-turn-helix domain-containing protein [Providencia huaxiensis]|uniref:helix-turn-helix domain-containing protein n=1 Tax=Providencia huaxiensis TaxID=2027290 RepID=UPI0034DD5853